MLQEARKFLVIARLTKSVVAISSVISVDCFAIGPYDLAKSFLGNETIEETS